MVELMLGGIASGKSRCALAHLAALPSPALLVVTGKAHDMGLRAQIERHRHERSPQIPVVECDLDLAAVLVSCAPQYPTLVVDSLDFWVFRALQAGVWKAAEEALVDVVRAWSTGHLLLVSQEMGLCPVAADSLTRILARALGGLHQKLAPHCSHVYLVVAGLVQTLK